jgi:hypothetical protein
MSKTTLARTMRMGCTERGVGRGNASSRWEWEWEGRRGEGGELGDAVEFASRPHPKKRRKAGHLPATVTLQSAKRKAPKAKSKKLQEKARKARPRSSRTPATAPSPTTPLLARSRSLILRISRLPGLVALNDLPVPRCCRTRALDHAHCCRTCRGHHIRWAASLRLALAIE